MRGFNQLNNVTCFFSFLLQKFFLIAPRYLRGDAFLAGLHNNTLTIWAIVTLPKGSGNFEQWMGFI